MVYSQNCVVRFLLKAGYAAQRCPEGTAILHVHHTQRLQCSSFVVMTCFLLRVFSTQKGTTLEPLGIEHM